RNFGDVDDDGDSRATGGRRITALGATPGTNIRTSGAQTASRSESDIRINYWNPSKIIAASNNIASSGLQGVYYSTDGGVTWTFDGTISGTQTNTDKQMEWVDHSASSPYANNIYVIWHNGNPAYMN